MKTGYMVGGLILACAIGYASFGSSDSKVATPAQSASKSSAPEWVSAQAPGLYKSMVERENQSAKDSFGPLYKDDSKVEVISVDLVGCDEAAADQKSWTCKVRANLRLAGSHEVKRDVEVSLAQADSGLSIVGTRRLGF